MAITYKWKISQMNAHIQSEGEDNVIFRVEYNYVGYEESGGVTYTSSIMSFEDFVYVAGEPFVPYEDTEDFENVVIGWLEDAADVSIMQARIAADIQSQITPVNEDLYFTWQNPVPQAPPAVEDEEE